MVVHKGCSLAAEDDSLSLATKMVHKGCSLAPEDDSLSLPLKWPTKDDHLLLLKLNISVVSWGALRGFCFRSPGLIRRPVFLFSCCSALGI